MTRVGNHLRLPLTLVATIAMLVTCCAADWLPRIDPSGRRLFLPPGEYPYQPQPKRVTRHTESGVQILPTRAIAPVGAEVVMTAGVCGKDGFMSAFERVEWSLAPGGVGYFVDVGKNDGVDNLRTRTRPQKVDNTFAIGITAADNTMLTRGTPTKTDDVPILRGQSWITVSSPIEGTSYITAYAPDAYTWDKRKDTSTIYWIDANWALPAPVARPAGSEHTLVTTLHRATTHLPLPNWRVRYEIIGGPAAVFLPNNTPAVEVISNALGQAPVQIRQVTPAAGVNDIRVQIIRPGEISPDNLRLTIVNHVTRVTWGGNQLTIDKQGPAQAATGQTFSYRIDVRNASQQTIKGVVLSDPIDAGLTIISTNPPTTPANQVLQWNLQDLVAGEARAVEIVVRAERPGPINNCASVRSADGVVVQDCVTTSVTAPELRLEVTAPDQALVGQRLTYLIGVTNVSGIPATGLILVDRFDPGFRHSAAVSPIERELGDLQPGQMVTLTVELEVLAPGQHCNVVEIQGRDGSVRASARKCLTAIASAAPPVTPTIPTTPTPTQPQPTTPATPAQPQPAQPPVDNRPKPVIAVRKTGPDRKGVGERADFVIDITNQGTILATNLKVVDNYDQALSPVQATDGHAFAGDDLVWIVDQLPPGRTIRFQVNCQCNRRSPRACNRVTVTTAEGTRVDGEACMEILGPVNPLSMTVSDSRDPLGLGNDCTYEIRLKSNSSEPDRTVRVTVVAPPELTPVDIGTNGPGGVPFTIQGQVVQFSPLNELRAGELVVYRVNMRAIRPGNAVVKVEVTSNAAQTPVTADATTTVLNQQQ